jgi:hypothetical protein
MPQTKSYSFRLIAKTRTYSAGKYHTVVTMKDWDDDVTLIFQLDTREEVIDVGNLSVKCLLPDGPT